MSGSIRPQGVYAPVHDLLQLWVKSVTLAGMAVKPNYEAMRKKVADRVRGLREKARPFMAQDDLAKAMGTSRRDVVRIESGEKPISLELIGDLAAAFRITEIDFLCGGADPVWPFEDPDLTSARREARNQKWEAELQEQMQPIVDRFADVYLKTLLGDLGRLTTGLEDFQTRLQPLLQPISIDAFNREMVASGLSRHLDSVRREANTKRRVSRGS